MGEIRHRLVVLHPQSDLVLAVTSAEGAHLPRLTLPERHTAEVEHLNAAVRARWGLETVVLRGLEHVRSTSGVEVTHLLEARSLARLRDAVWVEGGALAAADGAIAGRVLESRAIRPAQPALREWEGRGWWDDVLAWIEAQVGAADVVQMRAWDYSCVARVTTRGAVAATHYFKALPATGERELGVTAWLDGRPGAPRVAAVQRQRRWLLLHAFAGASLDDVRDAAAWRRAAATWGGLQKSTLGCGDELGAIGCARRTLADLEAAIEPLLGDTAAMMPAEAEGLSPARIAALRARGDELRTRCRRLEEVALPEVLDHGDLWPSNLLVDDGACVIIDWEDAAVAPPFLGLAPLLAMVREWRISGGIEPVLEDSLAAWRGVRPEAELRAALAAALPLGMVDLAVRYWRMPPAVVALHPWMREMVPFFLRHALAVT